jgi:hypothetical protein
MRYEMFLLCDVQNDIVKTLLDYLYHWYCRRSNAATMGILRRVYTFLNIYIID